ncbi:enoyl-CoA hydratase/isomerase family protein [Bacillus sp. FJAT-49732]|uniref:Enoyl-CoA hydratase/isomerase family protein n=1 Tax=Lederbergia citrisecunda TaxID=2833583 RepID=A0A942YKG7_9BACI|nr:enoyl-CoA hydratase-related protein [Lederbergia citrisecunda]MBS4198575.1 enoyl-CoA hydratase/isomerase family protein [Lederbergia citrisecunda]
MDTLKLDINQYIAVVTLYRPESLNALNYDMLVELSSIVDFLKNSPESRLVIFRGEGERAFSVGADLKERKKLTEQEVLRYVNKIGEVFLAIENLPQPTIATINGYAFGGGLELALACDFRFASSHAMLGLTETSLAIIPGAGGTQRLPRLIGETKALELILTAKKMTAFEAEAYGIVLKTIEKERFMEEVIAFAKKILENGPIAVQQAKYAIKAGMKTDLRSGLEIERMAYEATIPTEDRKEALKAFSEKRKPIFKGK